MDYYRSYNCGDIFFITMIRLIFGNLGSGKTASVVRYMKLNPHKNFITNIDIKGRDFNHVMKLKPYMILKKTLIKTKKDGTPVHKLSLNKEFWVELISKYKKMNVVIDEAHSFFNSRRSSSSINIIMTDFLALLRRVLGGTDTTGELILITQLSRRLDVIAKEMSTDVTFCIHHYLMFCPKCKIKWQESNETPMKRDKCPQCDNWNIFRIVSEIEIYKFKDLDTFTAFKDYKYKTFYTHYYIKDIEKVFGSYNTLQFDDLLSEY